MPLLLLLLLLLLLRRLERPDGAGEVSRARGLVTRSDGHLSGLTQRPRLLPGVTQR